MSGMCSLCHEFYERYPLRDGHHQVSPHNSLDAITCAFPERVFSSANWNCQTMIALRDMAERDRSGFRTWNNDVSLGVLPILRSLEEDNQMGYLIMLWYKDRGHTSQAWVMDDDEEPQSLTLKTAEFIIGRRAS